MTFRTIGVAETWYFQWTSKRPSTNLKFPHLRSGALWCGVGFHLVHDVEDVNSRVVRETAGTVRPQGTSNRGDRDPEQSARLLRSALFVRFDRNFGYSLM